MPPATREMLWELHEAVAQVLYEKVKAGTATSGQLRCAVKFLKDNGIRNVPSSRGHVARLARTMRDRGYIN